MNDYQAKVSLDTNDLANATKSFGAVNQAISAFTSLLRMDFVSAAQQARGAFVAMRQALVAHPWIAVATAIAAVASALIGVAWKKRADEVKELREETERYVQTLRRLRGETLEIDEKAKRGADRMLEAGDETGLAANRDFAERTAQTAAQNAAELRAQIDSNDRSIDLPHAEKEVARLELVAERFRLAAVHYGAALSELQKKRTEAAQEAAAAAKAESERIAAAADSLRGEEERTALMQKLQGKSEPEKLRIRIDDANRRYAEIGQKRTAETDLAARHDLAQQQEVILQEIIAYRERLRDLAAAARRATEVPIRAERSPRRSDLRRTSEPYDLANSSTRAITRGSTEDLWDHFYENGGGSHGASRSPLNGFRVADRINSMWRDEDGVMRMAGSRAGGFASRLRPTSFARSAAELEARQRGGETAAARATVVRTGEEQPVVLDAETKAWIKKIAENSGGMTRR